MGKDRPYHDGGGLCSPGRWPRGRRAGNFEKGSLILGVARELLKESAGGEDKVLELVMKLAMGKAESSPFEEALVEGLRDWLVDHLGVPLEQRGKPEGQEIYLGITSLLLKELGDPDWVYPMCVSEGSP